GSGDPLLTGRIMDIHASLRMDERKLGDALDILGDLHRHYSACGETHLAGRALISRGIALHYDDRPREAVDSYWQGLAAIDRQREPKLVDQTNHALFTALVEAGEFHEARRLQLKSGLAQAFADDPLSLLKLRWVEGKIFAGTGKLRKAEEIFTEVL